MKTITVTNYRCFRGKQTAHLAPLTLLVGENSTGKTSFLAMIRALWDTVYRHSLPNFKEEPYDLGSFDEIAHYRGGRAGRADSFEAGFTLPAMRRQRKSGRNTKKNLLDRYYVEFSRKGTIPVPARVRFSRGQCWIDAPISTGGPNTQFRAGTSRGSWEVSIDLPTGEYDLVENTFVPFFFSFRHYPLKESEDLDTKYMPLEGSLTISPEDLDELEELAEERFTMLPRLYASAPIRSKPHRTYDPSLSSPDPEGNYVPMYLANLYFQNRRKWSTLKKALESFGQASGLFDEISIKPLGRRDAEPFQVQIRKFAGKLKGPKRNLIDVGYGVSQVLPVIAELLRQGAPPMFLLQQPEVHLHPSAQAALGSLFCQVAEENRQLVVETHSDHLLDRVRMDVRDQNGRLKPEDVSILFFQREGLDVRIHSLRLDGEGNVLNAPKGYRRFFLEETTRSLGL